MFDTHCHLNFGAFDGRVDEVIKNAQSVGVNQIVIPGTDVATSEKAVAIAEKYEGIYAAVGIHPHHVFEIWMMESRKLKVGVEDRELKIEKNQPSTFDHQPLSSIFNPLLSLLSHPKVVAIGEVGIDRHIYQKTKYPDYKIAEEFVELQKEFFLEQIKLAHKYKKALIIHNREAKKDVLEILNTNHLILNTVPAVFHCCEPDPELLKFAQEHKMFIGVDGDITYYKEKQAFIKTVPLEMLVLETDSPFLSPIRQFPNEPKNIKIIAKFIASLLHCSIDTLMKQTMENARILFKLGHFLSL